MVTSPARQGELRFRAESERALMRASVRGNARMDKKRSEGGKTRAVRAGDRLDVNIRVENAPIRARRRC
jgi:hypothetical protein